MKVIISEMTNADLIEAKHKGMAMPDWSDARLHYLPLIGYAARDESGELQGIGCVAWIGRGRGNSGKAMGILSITEAYRRQPAARLMLRRAKEVIELALLITPKIFATPDKDVPSAEMFLSRLGFVNEGNEWVRHVGLRNSSDPSDCLGGGVVRSIEEQCERRESGGDVPSSGERASGAAGASCSAS